MRQLFPEFRDGVGPADVYDTADRAPHADRPWVLLNMVASADGATVINGVSEHLGGPGDREIFLYLRSLADGILAGAGTVRAEGYGPPKVRPEHRAAREARGQSLLPRLCIATRGAGFDWSAPLFLDERTRPVILAPASADPQRLEEARRHCHVIAAGEAALDVQAALRALLELGIDVLLCEGGPSLNAGLLEAGVVDELCLTISPQLVGEGGGSTIVDGAHLSPPVGLQLASVAEHDGDLFLRYLAPRSPG